MTLPAALSSVTATSVGSLPHADPVEAAELVLRLHPELPAAPQLPNRSSGELMLAQAIDGLEGVAVNDDGTLAIEADALDTTDVTFGDECWDGLLTFLRLAESRSGPVKVQLTGPVTLAVALARGGASQHVARDIAIEAVRRRAAALVDLFDFQPLVLCIDEPWLGSAHPSIPVEDVITSVVEDLGPAVVAAVHCCGHADWESILDALPTPAVVSMPASPDAVAHAAALNRFLGRGGIVAWGVVPTVPPYVTDGDELWRRFESLLRALAEAGCDADVLCRQSWVTPECGLAGHSVVQAEAALSAARAVADLLRDHAV